MNETDETCPKCGWQGEIDTEAVRGYRRVECPERDEVEPTAYCPRCGADLC